jgi:hypothetical protein
MLVDRLQKRIRTYEQLIIEARLYKDDSLSVQDNRYTQAIQAVQAQDKLLGVLCSAKQEGLMTDDQISKQIVQSMTRVDDEVLKRIRVKRNG